MPVVSGSRLILDHPRSSSLSRLLPADLDITTVYDGSYLAGKRVLVTGGNRSLGLETVKELVAQGAQVVVVGRKTSEELDAIKAGAAEGMVQIITGVDVCNDGDMAKMVTEVDGKPLDIVINNAGYFPDIYEEVGVGDKPCTLDFAEQMKMINCCALGPLRVRCVPYPCIASQLALSLPSS